MKHIIIAISIAVLLLAGCGKQQQPQQQAQESPSDKPAITLVSWDHHRVIYDLTNYGPTRCGWITLDDEKSTHKSFDGGIIVLPERSKTQFTLLWIAMYAPLEKNKVVMHYQLNILPFYNREIWPVALDLGGIDIGRKDSPNRDYVRKVLKEEGLLK